MSEGFREPITIPLKGENRDVSVPAAWREFISFCRDLRHGEIHRLSIQDGLPVLAEVSIKKVKFKRDR